MLGIGRAAAIAEEEDLAAGGQTRQRDLDQPRKRLGKHPAARREHALVLGDLRLEETPEIQCAGSHDQILNRLMI